jgi:pimeloyl-ACP methyl ester carboxylesterase
MISLAGRRIERRWGRMRVWEAGTGEPLLLIHGLGGSGRYFDRLAARVSDRFHVVAPDLAGFGTSDKPDIAYDRAMHLDDLDAVAEEFELDRSTVVAGHSLGGLFAAMWAARDPGRVRGLSAMSAPYPSPDEHEVWVQEPKPPAAAKIALPIVAAAVRMLAIPVGVVRGYPPAVVADYARQTLRSRARTMRSALYDPAIADELEAIRALDGRFPVLIEHALEDRTVRLQAHEHWRTLLPSAEHHVVAGGHQVQLHSRFETLAAWLGRLPGR